MDLNDMYEWWNNAAKQNPMTSILSNCQQWDSEEFFRSGHQWLEQHRQFALSANVDVRGDAALDFGCGLGRMTAALGQYYSQVVGVDISDEMINKAKEINILDNVTFCQTNDIVIPFESQCFDLVYSTIVVQHIAPPYNMAILSEFFRLSRQLVMFDAPSHKISPTDLPPSSGIFLLDWRIVVGMANAAGFEMSAAREFPATATRHYQYLFKKC